MSRRRKKRHATGTGYIFILVLCIFGTITCARLQLNDKRAKLLEQQGELTKQLELEEERSKEIDDLSAYVQTKKYVEDMAREKFGLVYKNEILIQSEENEK